MANSRIDLSPLSAEFPASNYGAPGMINYRPVILLDPTTNESVIWSFEVPQGITSGYQARVHYIMASANTGDVDIDVSIEAITPGDAVDLDATDSFDTVNSTDNTTVPGTVGYEGVITVTLTNVDGWAAGDYARLKLTRDAASDTATGDMAILRVTILDGV